MQYKVPFVGGPAHNTVRPVHVVPETGRLPYSFKVAVRIGDSASLEHRIGLYAYVPRPVILHPMLVMLVYVFGEDITDQQCIDVALYHNPKLAEAMLDFVAK